MKTILILAAAMLIPFLHGQVAKTPPPIPVPTPTLADCLTEARLFSDSSPRGIVTSDQATVSELEARFSKLKTCRAIYMDDGAASKSFMDAINVQSLLLMTRYGNFIQRHGLRQQMIEEDEKGLRGPR